MPKIDVTFELVTPAFAGGAHRGRTDGLRPPTIKALLRFWWRAMTPVLASCIEFEPGLFGSRDSGRGLRVIPLANPAPDAADVTAAGIPVTQPFYSYLGLGPVGRIPRPEDPKRNRPGTVAQSLVPGFSRSFSLRWQARNEEEGTALRAELLCALWLLSVFGGIGSRSRRGWGSFMLKSVGDAMDLDSGWKTELDPPDTSRADGAAPQARVLVNPHAARSRAEAIGAIKVGLATIVRSHQAVPRHSAFATGARVLVGPEASDWKSAMAEIHDKLYGYRRLLGANAGHPDEQIGPDFDLRQQWNKPVSPKPAVAPRAAAFGLPLNAKTGNVSVGEDLSGRRASPLFFKVLKYEGGYLPLALWLPSEFLGTGQTYAAGLDEKSFKVAAPTHDGVRDFLDGVLIPQGAGSHAGTTKHDPKVWPPLTKQGWTSVWRHR